MRPENIYLMRPRPRPRPITVRPRPRPKKWSRDHAGLETLTSLPYIRYTTYNSLPRRAAVTQHTDCHSGQQQQPGLAQRVKAGRNRWCRVFANNPIRWAFTSQAFTRWRHQSEVEHISIALLFVYRPR